MRRIIPPRPGRPPPIVLNAWLSSSGSPLPSSEGSWANMPPIASTARSAIGSHSFDQTGSVASTHSDRLQASVLRTPVLKLVASSSHRSASRTASTTFWRSTSRTLGSPSAATACRATFLARSQFTGPPCHDIKSANWRSTSANCCGSPSGPSGPPSPGEPPDEPDPEPPGPDEPGPDEPEPDEPEPRPEPPGG